MRSDDFWTGKISKTNSNEQNDWKDRFEKYWDRITNLYLKY